MTSSQEHGLNLASSSLQDRLEPGYSVSTWWEAFLFSNSHLDRTKFK